MIIEIDVEALTRAFLDGDRKERTPEIYGVPLTTGVFDPVLDVLVSPVYE